MLRVIWKKNKLSESTEITIKYSVKSKNKSAFMKYNKISKLYQSKIEF